MATTRLTFIYGTRTISPVAPASVARLLGQVIQYFVKAHPTWNIEILGSSSFPLEDVNCKAVVLNRRERAILQLSKALNKSNYEDFWSHKACQLRARQFPLPEFVIGATSGTILHAKYYLPTAKRIYWIHSLPSLGRENRILEAISVSDALVVPSRAIYKALWNLYQRQCLAPPVWVIPNWIDTSLFTPPNIVERQQYRAKYSLSESDIAIIHIGGNTLHKGRQIIEHALTLCESVEGRIVLFSAGGISKGRKSLGKNIELVDTGHLSVVDILELYKAVDFGVVPSVWFENAPLAVMEMMSSGLCVLASDVGGIPEILQHGETGLLIEEPNMVEEWLKVLNEIFTQKELRYQLGKQARQAALEDFGGEKPLEHWNRLIKSFITVGK